MTSVRGRTLAEYDGSLGYITLIGRVVFSQSIVAPRGRCTFTWRISLSAYPRNGEVDFDDGGPADSRRDGDRRCSSARWVNDISDPSHGLTIYQNSRFWWAGSEPRRRVFGREWSPDRRNSSSLPSCHVWLAVRSSPRVANGLQCQLFVIGKNWGQMPRRHLRVQQVS